MTRRDNASNYLNELIACAKRLEGRWRPGDDLTLDVLGDAWRLKADTDVENNSSLRAAFDAFGLDPSEPHHWRVLLAWFAEAHFVASRPRGRKRDWTGLELCQLVADFAAVKQKNPNEADEKICDRLREQFGGRYAGLKARTIVRKLQHAKDPKTNSILAQILKDRPNDPRGMTAEQAKAHALECIAGISIAALRAAVDK